VTGDGKLDAVVAHDDAEIVSVLAGDGAGGLERVGEIELGGRGFDVELVDVDGNGTLDLACTSFPAGIALLQGDGRGGFAHAPGSPYAIAGEPAGVSIGDIDGDLDLDLVAVSRESGELTVWLRD
jgi:hypothetical protein